jgi:DNA-binding MarR family transcriptional regulator/catechol 2,3-dioxygenase-like lactoylglutathione lyase family enzyme
MVFGMDGDRSQLSTPTLMRSARGAYAQSIRAELHAIGIDDLPRNGALILAGIVTSGGPRQDLPSALGVTKQAVSLVIDTLVDRGYLDRRPDPDDRRRVILELTDRGQEAVDAVRQGVEAIDRQLQERVSPEQIGAMRAVLVALAEIKTSAGATGTDRRRPPRQLRHFSPIFPVRDLAAALAHYRALGFETHSYDAGYGFADRDGLSLHLAVTPRDDSAAPTASAYLLVRDADALYAQWNQPGIGGRTHAVEATPYRLREGSHVDPDGNLIRFGSPMPE